mgnify:CR=1 FL=1
MSKKHNQKLITPEILRQAVIGSFQKLNPRYMMKNPVMFVVEVGCAITGAFLLPECIWGFSAKQSAHL